AGRGHSDPHLAPTRRIHDKANAGLMARAYDDIPGAKLLFLRQGYREVRRFHKMTVRIDMCFADGTFAPDGVTIRAFQLDHLKQFVAAHHSFFANHWGAQKATVEDWKRRMIEGRPHDPSLWIIAWSGERIVGECLCNASQQDGPRDGWISTVGVHAAWRRRGLGRAILRHGLRA